MPSVDPTHVPTLFKWSQTWGNHICIAGSFDPPIPTWTPIEMKKNKDHVHEVTLDLLPDKKYYFKFVIDGNWVLDEGYPSCPDSSGNWNHEIQVELPPPPPAEEEKEEVVVDEQVQQEVAFEEEKHQEMTDEHQLEQQQEVQVINEDHQEEHHHDHQAIAEDHKIEQQHQEDQIIDEAKEEQNQYQEVHHVDETEQQHQEEQVVGEDKEEQHQPQLDHQIVAEDHHVDEIKQQHQEEQVVNEDKEEQNLHQEDLQVAAEDHHVDENKQQHQEEQVVNEDKEEHHQHQEDHQVVEELHQHHHEDDQKEQHNEDQTVTEINTTEQSLDVPVITGAKETETIINETMVEQPELSSTVKETIIESDNDQLSAEYVANNIDDAIIEETHDESMTTKSNETLHTPQNDTESISPVIIDENVEKITPEISETEGQNIEQSEDLINEFKVTEETSSAGEKQETVVSSTTETEIPIESSSFSTDEINEGEVYEPEHKTINENKDDENEEDYDYENEGAEGSEDTIAVAFDENLAEETLKEVLLNNTWAKDDSLEETIPSSWTESYESQSVIWPDNTNLKWSDINKEVTAETKIETTNKPETEVEDYSDVLEETRVTEITSNDESNVNEEVLSRETPETITEQIVEEISAQSVVESHIEHKTKESDYETGINNQVPTSEVKERMPSFAQFEKPESSATADKIPVLSSIPTTVVAAPVEEIVAPKAIDTPKVDDVLKDNISRKIISISPSTSSPGESTRNADMHTHNITVATNTSLSPIKETKHMKPVVEITSREILQKDSKIVIQHDEEEEKIDLNDMAYLATSVATTFTLGIISMLYKSVFRTKNQ